MFDTMTMTKIVGSLCGMLLVFLFGNWAAESLYRVGSDGHGEAQQAYFIDTGEDEAHGEEDMAEEAVDFGVVLAAADAAAGEKLFKACQSCHVVVDDAGNTLAGRKATTGPNLFEIVGGAVGAQDGFRYSGKLVAVTETWSAEELSNFLENPKGYAPGTKMTYKGMKDIEDRANLIAWLDSLDG